MAEENQEEQQNKGQGFYPFSIHRNEAVLETRERSKNNFSFDRIQDVFGKDEDGNFVDAGALLKNLQEEITNLRKVLKDGGEINTRLIKDGDLPYWADCIKDRSDYLQNYQDAYKAYEAERSHIVAEIEELKAARDAALKAAEEKAGTDEAEQEKIKAEQLKTQIEEAEQKRDALTEKDAYKDAVLEHGKFEAAENTIKKVLEGDIGLLSELPQETMEHLLQFKEKCGEENKELFNEAYEALFMSRPYGPEYVYTKEGRGVETIKKDENGRPIIQNEHRFATDSNGRLVHTIRNLDNTGLDITWIGDHLGLAHTMSDMKEDQVKALAEYCFANGVVIDDYFKLNNLKVVDKDNKEIGTAAERLKAEMDKLTKEYQEQLNPLSQEGPSSFAQFLPPLGKVENAPKKMKEAVITRAKLQGFSRKAMKVKHGVNSTIISVYLNENDMIDDGKMDKAGHRKHTKQYAVELHHTVPPIAEFYMEPGKKFEADHARTILDAFKAVGCKYFIIPSADELGGKEACGAFMKASVKTGMVPLLKRGGKGKGSQIGVADLELVLKEIPEEASFNNDTNAKVEYLMRWHQQLERYTEGNPKAAKTLDRLMGKFQQQALFAQFAASHLENMEKYMQQGADGKLEGGKWDGIDKITAKIAMARIIHEIQAGKVDGKPYNPLADNNEMLKKTLDKYMKQARMGDGTEQNPGIEKEVIKLQEKYAKERDPLRNALQELDRKYGDRLRVACESVASNGGPEIKRVNVPEISPIISEQRRTAQKEPQKAQDSKSGWTKQPTFVRNNGGRS